MQLEDVLLEEYKSVRQESLEAAGRVQSVTQYLFAAGGVAITVGLVAADKDETAGAAVLMALIPLVVVLGIAMMTLEIQRVLGARRHLQKLETRINALLDPPEEGLSWEAARLTPEMRPLNPFPIVFVVALAGIVVIGPGIGGLVLRDDLTTWYFIGAAADLILAVVVTVVALRTYPRLRELEKTGATHSSGPLGG
jgi:hypothetical protein